VYALFVALTTSYEERETERKGKGTSWHLVFRVFDTRDLETICTVMIR